MKRKAVVLLSGGLDSAVTLFYAGRNGFDCHCLTFDYGQRHRREIDAARAIAGAAGSRLTSLKVDLPCRGSSLTDEGEPLPLDRKIDDIKNGGIPSTYVPGRNTIFLSIAASFAESIGATDIFIGAHSEDSSGYPDCTLEYLRAFDKAVRLGTKAGLEGRLRINFPLIDKNKARIIKLGRSLGVPFDLTWSCYSGGELPCGRCDSCLLREKGFKEADTIEDPAYA